MTVRRACAFAPICVFVILTLAPATLRAPAPAGMILPALAWNLLASSVHVLYTEQSRAHENTALTLIERASNRCTGFCGCGCDCDCSANRQPGEAGDQNTVREAKDCDLRVVVPERQGAKEQDLRATNKHHSALYLQNRTSCIGLRSRIKDRGSARKHYGIKTVFILSSFLLLARVCVSTFGATHEILRRFA